MVAQYVGSRDVGSSPLTRGKPELTPLEIDDLRLIPAHAGKTRGQESRHEGSPAHPRSRGENQAAKPLGRKDLGSSPLTRGKLPEAHRLLGGKRLIPAHAGKTRATRRTRYRMRAHPRSRGENPSAAAAPASTCGSSPLTRGKRQRWNGPRGGIGLIPAHAGKTFWRACSRRPVGAHPRSRGENDITPMAPVMEPGSSPLTRGKQPDQVSHELEGRLIPAHAGKTDTRRPGPRSRGAHPRSRGENVHEVRVLTSDGGSSPLTRGKH